MISSSQGVGILDTNTVILLPLLRNPDLLPKKPTITAITLAELSVGPLVASTPIEQADRQAHLQQAESDFDALPFDQAAARASVLWPPRRRSKDLRPRL